MKKLSNYTQKELEDELAKRSNDDYSLLERIEKSKEYKTLAKKWNALFNKELLEKIPLVVGFNFVWLGESDWECQSHDESLMQAENILEKKHKPEMTKFFKEIKAFAKKQKIDLNVLIDSFR